MNNLSFTKHKKMTINFVDLQQIKFTWVFNCEGIEIEEVTE